MNHLTLPPRATQAMLLAPTRKRALDELKARQLAGEVAGVPGQLRLLTMGPHAGQYGIPVYLLPRRREDPPWAARCRAASFVLLGVAAVLAALAWLVSSLSALALATAIVTVGVVFCVSVWAKYGRRRGSISVVQSVTVQR